MNPGAIRFAGFGMALALISACSPPSTPPEPEASAASVAASPSPSAAALNLWPAFLANVQRTMQPCDAAFQALVTHGDETNDALAEAGAAAEQVCTSTRERLLEIEEPAVAEEVSRSLHMYLMSLIQAASNSAQSGGVAERLVRSPLGSDKEMLPKLRAQAATDRQTAISFLGDAVAAAGSAVSSEPLDANVGAASKAKLLTDLNSLRRPCDDVLKEIEQSLDIPRGQMNDLLDRGRNTCVEAAGKIGFLSEPDETPIRLMDDYDTALSDCTVVYTDLRDVFGDVSRDLYDLGHSKAQVRQKLQNARAAGQQCVAKIERLGSS